MIELYRFDVDYLGEERGMKHIPCDNGDYVLAEDALALQAKVEKLTKAITDFREGNYAHPRSYRPNNCPHGAHYWRECADCDEEYWQSVLEVESLSQEGE